MEKALKPARKVLIFALLASLLAVIYVYCCANLEHYTAYMEADIASETLLSQVLYENGHVQPDSWYMSTGRRILSPPMLASFLHRFSAGDMNGSMGAACAVMMIFMLAAMFYFNRQIGLGLLENLVMVLLSFVLSAPANETQRMLFLYSSYYVGHFTCMFLVLGFYAKALKEDKVSLLTVIVTVPLAVLNGAQGMHASMFFYMPLLGAEILRRLVDFLRKKKEGTNLITVWVCGISILSLVSIKIFGDHIAGEMSRNLRHAPEKFFGIVLPFFKEVLGYGRMTPLIVIFVLMAIAGYAFAIKNFDKNRELWSILPVPFGVIVVIISTTFTTAEAAPRYFLMQVFFVGIGAAMLINLYKTEYTALLSALVVIYGAFSAVVFYDALIVNDNSANTDYAKVADWMKENGYEFGYSTFDHANTITVISNNTVKVRAINNFKDLEGAKWLTDATWYPPIKDSAGATCYVVSKTFDEDFKEFEEQQNPKIIDMKEFERFNVYVTDRDYTIWE